MLATVDPQPDKHTPAQWFYLLFLLVALGSLRFVPEQYTYWALGLAIGFALVAELIGLRLRWEGLRYAPAWLLLVACLAVALGFDHGFGPALAAVLGGLAVVPVTIWVNQVRDTRADEARFAELRTITLTRFDPRGDHGWDQLADTVFNPRAAAWDAAMCEHNRRVAALARTWLLERGLEPAVELELTPIHDLFGACARDHGQRLRSRNPLRRAARSMQSLIRTRARTR